MNKLVNKTEINHQINDHTEQLLVTEINPVVPQATELNKSLQGNGPIIEKMTVIAEQYTVIGSLKVTTGEADLFLCTKDNKQFVAKIYRRSCAIKNDVAEILKVLNSPYVATLYDFGLFQGMPYEILPYYSKGSVSGRTFSLEQLKNNIIPSINEGLRSLHLKNVFHKDIKPANLMLLDDESGVAIIDFGISSVTEDGNTVLLTKTGMTPVYSSPEAMKSMFSELSDYYSLGITIFELFVGETPYQNASAEEIAQYTALQKIPFPDTFPEELKELIQGLTYSDITNRQDKTNPNRRWTYEEVCKWLKGEKQVIPGMSKASLFEEIPSYLFLDVEYDCLENLVVALAEHWEDGKKQLYRGLLSGYFKKFNPQLAGYCLDSEEEATENSGQDDIVFWKLLYKLVPKCTTFYWKNSSFESLAAFGRHILESLWAGNLSNVERWQEILSLSLMTKFLTIQKNGNKQQKQAVELVETFQGLSITEERNLIFNYYCTGYLLSNKVEFRYRDNVFNNPQELSDYMGNLLDGSLESLQEFCHNMLGYDNTLDPQLEAWLIAQGKRKELERWRSTMSL